MVKIWGRTNSTNVKKVLWCAGELKLPFERIEAGGAFGIVNDPAYRALNPNGLVPVLEDGDTVLWESNTIIRYLAAQYGAGSLWPSDPAKRAQGEKWMDWTISTLAPPFRDVFWNTVRLGPADRNMDKMDIGLAACGKLLGIVDQALSDKPYLSGETFGVADIPLGCYVYAWFEMDIPRPDLPNLQRWYDRLRAREAYRAAVVIPLT